ncbi:MAG: P pilus assembly chaperone PapD [Alphaproteobacteria bacterium]|jgi:P pilus assembly chaperone PapD
MFKFLFSTFVVSLLFAPLAQAGVDISLGAVQRYFLSDMAPYQTLSVSNNSDSRSFELKGDIRLFTNLDDFDRTKLELEPVDNHFLFAPKLFVLEPGTSRKVRLVRTAPIDDKERVYTLAYKPEVVVTSDVDGKQVYKKKVKLGITTVTRAAILVYVSPKVVDFNVTYKRDEKGVYFLNEGNITSELRRHHYCYEIEDEKACIDLPANRLSPGESYFYAVDANIPLVWTVKAYDTFQTKARFEPFEE